MRWGCRSERSRTRSALLAKTATLPNLMKSPRRSDDFKVQTVGTLKTRDSIADAVGVDKGTISRQLDLLQNGNLAEFGQITPAQRAAAEHATKSTTAPQIDSPSANTAR